MLKIAVCDNEPAVIKQIECYLSKVCQTLSIPYNMEWFPSGEDLLGRLYRGSMFDMIYLDINMGGIEVGKHLRNQLCDMKTLLIFISPCEEKAADLFECNTFRLLIRPIRQEKFTEYFKSACQYLGLKERKHLEFKEIRGEREKVPFDDIIYLESTGRVIQLVTRRRKYRFYGKLAETALYFRDDDFIRIHNSILVNFDYISLMGYGSVLMKNGETKDISGPKRKNAREVYLVIRRNRGL